MKPKMMCHLDFVTAFSIVGHAPGSLWDLSSSSPHYLRNRSKPIVQITLKTIKDNKALYFIESLYLDSSRNPLFQLAVPHAATAVQCLWEEWGPHFEVIIRHMLQVGIPFSTCVPGPPPNWITKSPHPIVGLGYHPPGYKPDLVDYAAYENARIAFCDSEQHAHAALMQGGIAWRLVQDHLTPDDILAGPTAGVYHHGHPLLTSPDGHALWDDDLSEDELDLICGVYKVSTGMIFLRLINLAPLLTSKQVRVPRQHTSRGGQSSPCG
jgi:hypothetical protein